MKDDNSQKPNTKPKPYIMCTKYTPFMVKELEEFKNDRGEDLETQFEMSLCRCGHSKNKPYCDGSHSDIKFIGEKSPDRVPDRVKEYKGKEVTIVDNRGVCSHDKSCVECLPGVFDRYKRPWIDPDGAGMKEIIETIEKCPSGALSYKIGDKHYKDLDNEPAIIVSKDGPLHVVGGIELKDDMGSQPETKEHYTLCRCGESKNKPFCDGTHLDIDFKGD
jgi:CDGSH-type Zn-finger protein